MLRGVKLFVDTDAGVDDALALLLVLGTPGAELLGIGAVDGNVPLPQVVANVFEVLVAAGREVPVYAGADRPLVLEPRERATFFHGEDGLGNLKARRATIRPEATPAALALVELAKKHPGELRVAALGPLTNLALALLLEPRLPKLVEGLFVMGGAPTGRGNTKRRAAEFNFAADPEAAHAVLAAFPKTTLLPWETTLAHPLPWAVHERLAERFPFYRAITAYTARYLKEKGMPGLLIPDPLAMGVALYPEIKAQTEETAALVELCGAHTRGMLVLGAGRANAELVLKVDQDRFLTHLEAALAHALGE